MASLLLEPLIDKSVSLAIFALDQGIQLFVTESERAEEDGIIERKENRTMDKYVVFNLVDKKGISRFINLRKAADNCLTQINNLALVWEASEFGTSLDYLKDAWRALSGDNVTLFKKYIELSYQSARQCKTKITKNPNHLLGVYSVIIFCGFCIFSEFGENMYLGLQHIKDTLNEMGSGSNKQSLLRSRLVRAIKPKFSTSDDQRMYLRNVVLFGLRVTTLVDNIIKYCKYNELLKANETNDDKLADPKLFGNIMKVLFPNATISASDSYANLLSYKSWCPNIFEGRYFGGDQDKVFAKMDFFDRVYALMFDKETYILLNTLIYVYHQQLAEYVLTSSEANRAIKGCIVADNDESVLHLSNKTKMLKQVAICLSVAGDVTELQAKQESAPKDDEKAAEEDDAKKKKKQKKKSKSKSKEAENESMVAIPDKVVIKSYQSEFDMIFSSPFCGMKTVEFDGCSQAEIKAFCDNLWRAHCNVNTEFVRSSITQITVRNTTISLQFVHELFAVVNSIGIDSITAICFESLTVEYSLYDAEHYSDALNLSLIPSHVETFRFCGIKWVESKQQTQKYDEKTVDKLMQLNIGNKRKILNAMDHVTDNTNFEEIKFYLSEHWFADESDQVLIRLVWNAEENEENSAGYKSLTTLDFSDYSTGMEQQNVQQLFNFVFRQCPNLETLTLCNCGLTNTTTKTLMELYSVNKSHTLRHVQLENVPKYDGKQNVFTIDAINQLSSFVSTQLSHRSDIVITMDDGYGKTTITGNAAAVSTAQNNQNKEHGGFAQEEEKEIGLLAQSKLISEVMQQDANTTPPPADLPSVESAGTRRRSDGFSATLPTPNLDEAPPAQQTALSQSHSHSYLPQQAHPQHPQMQQFANSSPMLHAQQQQQVSHAVMSPTMIQQPFYYTPYVATPQQQPVNHLMQPQQHPQYGQQTAPVYQAQHVLPQSTTSPTQPSASQSNVRYNV